MKKLFSIWAAILAIALTGCSKDDTGGVTTSAKLSPPAWIQGSWTDEAGGTVFYRFTSDDILQYGGEQLQEISFKQLGVYVPGVGGATVKETKKTDDLYEVTITASGGGDSVSGFYSFKKGNGTYIDAGTAKTGTTVDVYVRLYKKTAVN